MDSTISFSFEDQINVIRQRTLICRDVVRGSYRAPLTSGYPPARQVALTESTAWSKGFTLSLPCSGLYKKAGMLWRFGEPIRGCGAISAASGAAGAAGAAGLASTAADTAMMGDRLLLLGVVVVLVICFVICWWRK